MSSPLRVRLVAERPSAGGLGERRTVFPAAGCRRGPTSRPTPGPGSHPLIEAGQPVARDFFAHHEERLVLLTNGKFSFYLRVRWEVRLHLESDLDLAILGDHLKRAEAHVQIG